MMLLYRFKWLHLYQETTMEFGWPQKLAPIVCPRCHARDGEA
jgi:hypothetical protein